MTFPIVTATTAVAIAALQLLLMMSVGLTRARTGIGIGDGGQDALALSIRRHGNLIENAPILLILLSFVEVSGGANWLVSGLGITFLIARLAHAAALSQSSGPSFLRAVGAAGTMLSIMGSAGYLTWLIVQAG
jgi:uncharacterized membrane protein YecN with MAPEG domain